MNTDDLLHKVAVLSTHTRRQIISGSGSTTRLFTERTVKIVIRSDDQASMPYPRDLIDFADKLIVQTVTPFRGRGQVLEDLFREMPSRFNNFKVKLYSNELPPAEMINQAVKREMKFAEICLFNVCAEYTDKVDSFLKSARSLRLFRSFFRQIFPREMTNEVPNELELLQFDEVDFQAKNTLFKCDRLKALSLKKSNLKQNQLQDMTSTVLTNIAIENQFTFKQGDQQFSDFLELLHRQLDLQRLSINQSLYLPGDLMKMVAQELHSSDQTRVSFSTCGECCSLDEILESGILSKAADTFIACDSMKSGTAVPFMGGSSSANLIIKVDDGRTAGKSSPSKLNINEHQIAIERIGLYKKITVTNKQANKNELRIVTRQ